MSAKTASYNYVVATQQEHFSQSSDIMCSHAQQLSIADPFMVLKENVSHTLGTAAANYHYQVPATHQEQALLLEEQKALQDGKQLSVADPLMVRNELRCNAAPHVRHAHLKM